MTEIKPIASAPYYTTANFSGSSYAFNQPAGLAVDSSGNIWVVNANAGHVTEIKKAGNGNYSGVIYSGSSYGFDIDSGAIATDISGNIWVGNFLANNVTELMN